MGMTVPVEWDGAGADYVAYALSLEEIAAGDGAVSTIMSGHTRSAACRWSSMERSAQKEKYLRPMARGEMLSAFCLTEPQSGSDAGAIKTRAERRNGGYILNGTKQFITSGKNADVALVFAATDLAQSKQGISCFLVDTKQPGYCVDRIEAKMGQQASDTCAIRFAELHVPEQNRLGAEGQGYRIALANLEGGRIGVAAQAVGMARAALEIALAYAQDRRSFGKAIIEHQAVAFRLADMATQLEAAHQLVLHAAALRSQGLPCLKQASMAKLFATEAAERICSDAIQTLGGAGYMSDPAWSKFTAPCARARFTRAPTTSSAWSSAARWRARARRKNGPDHVPDRHRRCRDHPDAEPSAGECDQRRLGARLGGTARRA